MRGECGSREGSGQGGRRYPSRTTETRRRGDTLFAWRPRRLQYVKTLSVSLCLCGSLRTADAPITCVGSVEVGRAVVRGDGATHHEPRRHGGAETLFLLGDHVACSM